jgi:uncharacterized protein (TIGR02246 family)
MDTPEFAALLRRVADGWNLGDPRAAADCFTVDAVYVEPPDTQRHVGRDNLAAFFHGDGPEPRRMSMTWHHVAYDPETATGFGEYSFSIPGSIPGGFAAHGVAVVTVQEGRIATWREYQYPSTLSFREFAGDSLGPPPHTS